MNEIATQVRNDTFVFNILTKRVVLLRSINNYPLFQSSVRLKTGYFFGGDFSV